jgi:hypothetical protein
VEAEGEGRRKIGLCAGSRCVNEKVPQNLLPFSSKKVDLEGKGSRPLRSRFRTTCTDGDRPPLEGTERAKGKAATPPSPTLSRAELQRKPAEGSLVFPLPREEGTRRQKRRVRPYRLPSPQADRRPRQKAKGKGKVVRETQRKKNNPTTKQTTKTLSPTPSFSNVSTPSLPLGGRWGKEKEEEKGFPGKDEGRLPG